MYWRRGDQAIFIGADRYRQDGRLEQTWAADGGAATWPRSRSRATRKSTGISRRRKVRYNGFSATEGADMLLGAVTYNILKDWDLDTILTKLEAAGFDAVEL